MWPFESTSHMALLLQFPKTFSIHSRKRVPQASDEEAEVQKKETSAYASGWRELSGTVISWGQSPISRACLYPQGPEKVFVHECVTVCVHMCGCVNVYTQVFICTCASTLGNVVCIHTQLCVRARVCVCLCLKSGPQHLSPLAPCSHQPKPSH